MNARRRSSIVANPLLIGAITTLIVLVAVYLSYTAHNGLPFTPTYDISVELPEASGLQPGNQVRIGGDRVGVVDSISPYQSPSTGRVTAIVKLKLEKSVEPLPASTTAIVQSVSAVGLKYLQLNLNRGASKATIKPGEKLPLSHSSEPVDIDQFFDMFNAKTREASQINLTEFGDGFAGKGLGLNETIATLRPLVTHAVPVLHNLASSSTGLRQFFIALDRAAKEVAPVAQSQANFYSDLDTFFAAWAGVAPSFEKAIVGAPPALRQATASFTYQGPFLEKAAEFMRLLRPSASAARTTAPALGHAFQVGAVNLRAATSLNSQLASTAQAISSFAKNPIVALGIEDLTHTVALGTPIVAGLAPEQRTCNYITVAFRNLASVFSESIGVGTMARAGVVLSPGGPNNEGAPASAPANGPSIDKTATGTLVDDNHLHYNPYPNVAGPGQPVECEAGNEPYIAGKAVLGNVPGNVGTGHEATTRKQNLFGLSYPSSQLKDFPAESKSSGKSKSNAKGGKK
jgi:phospholipid/cholesterol/gamma-HCH transport system substrate-binding protein